MSGRQRIGLLAAALVVAVAAFLLLRPQDAGTPPPVTSASEPTGSVTGDERKPTRPEPPVIEVRGGEPKGGVADIDVGRGGRVRFEVEADAPEEVHVHGYDLVEEVGPGRAAKFDFEADLEGVYEVELEGSAVQIAELRVEP